MSVADFLLTRLRAHGADVPGADLRRARGTAMDGWFWRFTDPATGRAIVALCGLCRDRAGASWANVALAGHPGNVLAAADLGEAHAAPGDLALTAGPGALTASAGSLEVDLGPRARLQVQLSDRRDWARPRLGGCGPAHLIPGLGQYWHPHLLGARVRGCARLGDVDVDLAGWSAYGERNWGPGGFPPRWWWGQAQGFPDREVCVAFAGGTVAIGPARPTATAIVVRVGGRIVRLGNPLLAPVAADVGGGRWSLRARGPRYAVELEGVAGPADAVALPVPLPAQRRSVPSAQQHLAGRLRVVLRRRGRVVYSGESRLAGLESGTLKLSR